MGYGTTQGFTDWAARLGLSLGSQVTPAVALERGADYIDAVYGSRFCGVPTDGLEQENAWPRTGALYYGNPIPPDATPNAVVKAAYRAAYLASTRNGGLFITSDPSTRIKRQKVDGAAEREFFDDGIDGAGSGGKMIIDGEIEGLLAPFLCVDDVDEGGMQAIFAIGS